MCLARVSMGKFGCVARIVGVDTRCGAQSQLISTSGISSINAVSAGSCSKIAKGGDHMTRSALFFYRVVGPVLALCVVVLVGMGIKRRRW